jgi:hypothetical protein
MLVLIDGVGEGRLRMNVMFCICLVYESGWIDAKYV